MASPPTAADRRLLPEGRLAGPMPWVIAIMMFLTALAAAGGLAMTAASTRLGEGLGRRITVQVVAADPARRDREAAVVVDILNKQPGVSAVQRIADSDMKTLLKPWLGDAGVGGDLPLPAMIDADIADDARGDMPRLSTALMAAAPDARLEEHSQWLGPLVGLIRSLGWLAGGIVALMAGATAAAVVLAARAALNTHRGTIDVMHMMGATDVQVARLFQRRIALDALFGGMLGLLGAVIVILSIGRRLGEIGSGLIGSVGLSGWGWLILLLLPVLSCCLSLAVARMTVLRALGQTL